MLFADLSGFTALTERLAYGPAGAETLSAIIGDIFGRLVTEVARHRGDVLRFPGDAAICVWEESPDLGPAAAGALAAAAGLGIQRAMRERAPLADEKLTARVAVTEGPARIAFVGGADGRFEALADGDAIARAAPALRLGPGRARRDRPGRRAAARGRGARATRRLTRTVARSPVPPPGEAPRSDVAPALLAPFVPRGDQMRLEAKQSGWVAEFRRVSVLFVMLPSLGRAGGASLAETDAAFRAVQDCVYRFGGSVNQFLADDKGHVVLAIWGLPHAVHEDDPSRAGAAGVAVRGALGAIGAPFRAGIATGRGFCGLRGHASRLSTPCSGEW